VFAHIRSADRGAELIADLEGRGSFQLFEADLMSDGAVQRILDRVADAPQALQAIVNNAGGVMGETTSPETERWVMRHLSETTRRYWTSTRQAVSCGFGSRQMAHSQSECFPLISSVLLKMRAATRP